MPLGNRDTVPTMKAASGETVLPAEQSQQGIVGDDVSDTSTSGTRLEKKLSFDDIQQLRGRFERLEFSLLFLECTNSDSVTAADAASTTATVTWKDFRRVYAELDILQEELHRHGLEVVDPSDLRLLLLQKNHPRLLKVWNTFATENTKRSDALVERTEVNETRRLKELRLSSVQAMASRRQAPPGKAVRQQSRNAVKSHDRANQWDSDDRDDDLNFLKRRKINLLLDQCEATFFAFPKRLILERMGMKPPDIPLEYLRAGFANTLHTLSLAGNPLGNLPFQLVQILPALRCLDLAHCDLLLLPTLWDLPSLKKLNLSHNHIRNVPEEMWKGLPQLTDVNLYGNKILDLAPLTTNAPVLTKLQVLNVGFNDIAILPENLATLPQLKVLRVMNNFLTEVPRSICEMSPLRTIDVSFNPVISPPLETCERGINCMRRYYLKQVVTTQVSYSSSSSADAAKDETSPRSAGGKRPFKLSARPWFFSVVLLMLLGMPGGMASSRSYKLGPIGVSPQGYSWQAQVDRDTGRAFAKEVRNLPIEEGSILWGQNGRPSFNQMERLLGHFPEWLCRGSVTLGLLQVIPGEKGQLCIQTRLGGVSVLTFAPPVGQRFSVQTANGKQDTWQWKYPLRGGLLTSLRNDEGGYLYVKLRSLLPAPSRPPESLILETGLTEYSPRLVGRRIPPHPVRVGLYLATQSVLHGYVMWRFHSHARSQFSKVEETR